MNPFKIYFESMNAGKRKYSILSACSEMNINRHRIYGLKERNIIWNHNMI